LLYIFSSDSCSLGHKKKQQNDGRLKAPFVLLYENSTFK
jgi:hypothetical protein